MNGSLNYVNSNEADVTAVCCGAEAMSGKETGRL
jgi:hypothetical protein